MVANFGGLVALTTYGAGVILCVVLHKYLVNNTAKLYQEVLSYFHAILALLAQISADEKYLLIDRNTKLQSETSDQVSKRQHQLNHLLAQAKLAIHNLCQARDPRGLDLLRHYQVLEDVVAALKLYPQTDLKAKVLQPKLLQLQAIHNLVLTNLQLGNFM